MNKAHSSVRDFLWSVREDLHGRFDKLVGTHSVDGVLDSVAANSNPRISRFKKLFICKEATSILEVMANPKAQDAEKNSLHKVDMAA